jgi:hypothetical protein
MNSISRSRYLANSSASKRGRISASLSSSISSARSRARNCPLTEIDSAPAPALKLPPTPSTASANSNALRLPAPRSSSPATSDATPGLSAGSASAPPRTKPLKAMSGTSFFGTRMMVSPFGSTKRSWAGTLTPAGGVSAASAAFTMRAPARIAARAAGNADVHGRASAVAAGLARPAPRGRSQHAHGSMSFLEHQGRGLLHVVARHLFIRGGRIEELAVVAFEYLEGSEQARLAVDGGDLLPERRRVQILGARQFGLADALRHHLRQRRISTFSTARLRRLRAA